MIRNKIKNLVITKKSGPYLAHRTVKLWKTVKNCWKKIDQIFIRFYEQRFVNFMWLNIWSGVGLTALKFRSLDRFVVGIEKILSANFKIRLNSCWFWSQKDNGFSDPYADIYPKLSCIVCTCTVNRAYGQKLTLI